MAISLNSIRKTTAIAAPRIFVYGVAGIGKTTLGAGAPRPIFLFTEDGSGSLGVDAFPLLKSYEDVMSALAALYQEKNDYQTLVLDSVDHLEPLIWAQACADHGHSTIEDFGYGKGYMHALTYWRGVLGGLNALREKGMSIILLGHSQVVRFDDPSTDSYDRFCPKLHKRANELVMESTDAVFFMNYRTYTRYEDLGFNQKKVRGITSGERVLYTRETPAFVAKNRYGLPPEIVLPELPANPWDAVHAALATSIATQQANT